MSELTPQSLIQSSIEIFSLPDIYYQISEMITDPRYTAEDMGVVIAKDPGLSVRLLKIVNSSFYGFQAKIDTISRAITIVGIDDLNSLVLATSVIEQFNHIPADLVDMTDFWLRSIRCGIIAKLLAKECCILHTERLFLTGLLHDIGSLIMYCKIPDKARAVLLAANYNRELVGVIEKQVMGFTHADVGGELMETWGLPESLFEAVACYLEPEAALINKLDTHLVNLASRLADLSQQDVMIDVILSELSNNAKTLMQVDRELVDKVMFQVDVEFAQIFELMMPEKRFH